MKALGWGLIGLPLMAAVVLFALSNRELVSLTVWPVATELQAPLFLVILLVALVSFLTGAIVVWAMGVAGRNQARKDRRKLEGLSQEQAGWSERSKKEAEEAYTRREEERYAKAVQGKPSSSQPDTAAVTAENEPSGAALPAPRQSASA